MAYAGEAFRHDIFVSYSHGDLQGSGDNPLKRWSNRFARALEEELKILPGMGRDLRIFIDSDARPSQGVDPTSPLTEQLRENVRSSAMLAVLMSPHYLESEWCEKERDWWLERQKELGLPHDGRIAVIRIWPISKEWTEKPWPEAFKDAHGEELVGFTFYDRKRPDWWWPYGWPDFTGDTMNQLNSGLLGLVGSLKRKLEELRQSMGDRNRRTEQAQRLTAPGGQLIYLHGRSDDAKAWETAGTRLTEGGFVVLPDAPEAVEPDPKRSLAARELRVQMMSGCDALLLVGSGDGRALDADLVTVGHRDRHSARAIADRLLPCAVLDDSDAINSSPRRRQTARGLGIDVISGTSERWSPEVHSWLQQKSAHPGAA